MEGEDASKCITQECFWIFTRTSEDPLLCVKAWLKITSPNSKCQLFFLHSVFIHWESSLHTNVIFNLLLWRFFIYYVILFWTPDCCCDTLEWFDHPSSQTEPSQNGCALQRHLFCPNMSGFKNINIFISVSITEYYINKTFHLWSFHNWSKCMAPYRMWFAVQILNWSECYLKVPFLLDWIIVSLK